MFDNYERNEFGEYSRFSNLDGIEAKIVNILVNANDKYGNIIWKLLKYNSLNALSEPDVTKTERWKLVSNDNGEPTSKRIFISPFIDNAWQEQCCSLYIYVERIVPVNRMLSSLSVTIDIVNHAKTSVIYGDGDPTLNYVTVNQGDKPQEISLANPNDSDREGNIVVAIKNRATVLLKSLIAELNGKYIDGIGYLNFDNTSGTTRNLGNSASMSTGDSASATLSLYNNRSFYGYRVVFNMKMAGISGADDMEMPGEQY